ncbi:MAG: sugar-phosphate nucleotidyltransferase [Mycoplasma sp.]|nr:sugar-phosphate nucleotidyltransferase [Mycoplasma sp.]
MKIKKNNKDKIIEEYILSAKARTINSIRHAFNYKNDDEWYTTKEDVEHFIINANIPKNKIIWCPFDTKDSNFVKVFSKYGYKVVYSHIWDGKDFYEYEPKKWDIIVSNPPFRGKHKLLERLLHFNKPFALIFGIQCLNSEKFCDQLQKFKRPQYVHLKRRMCFTKDVKNYDVLKLDRPSFASMWVCNDLFETDIIVWNGVNYKNDNKEYC